jgi:SAM-dependent methyltransferase
MTLRTQMCAVKRRKQPFYEASYHSRLPRFPDYLYCMSISAAFVTCHSLGRLLALHRNTNTSEGIMAPVLFRALKSAVNVPLASVGMRIARIDDHDWSDVANYIPFERTLEAAAAHGLSVGDYVDTVMNGVPGSSQNTIDAMTSIGVFDAQVRSVVEVGPGTGRYLEKTISIAKPDRYEIYETAGPWSRYLQDKYAVEHQPTDGYTMGATVDHSVDLAQSHKVFSTVPFLVTCCYFREFARVVRDGGWVVFDIVTERCLDVEAMETWAAAPGIRNGSYPAVFPREVAIAFFRNNGFKLVDSFVLPMPPGSTELLAFKRGA